MINYSIAMRTVNQNFIAINAAKSRVKEAEKKGEKPKQEDVDLLKTEVQKAFAVAQYADVMNIEKFAKHIATHGCVYSRGDISAILYLAVDCMREMLLEGKKIRLGDLGDFSINLASTGAETAEKFSAQNITAVKVVWESGPEFKDLINEAEFNLVASRKAQAAVVSAIKAGKTVVDLNDPKGEGEDDGTSPDGTSGGGQNPPADNSQQTGGQTPPSQDNEDNDQAL